MSHVSRAPTLRLLAGLAITLSAVALYAGYTVLQLRGLEQMQGGIIERNRADSLLLLRIQNNLNSIGLTMRDMLDGSEPYPLTAYQGQFRRLRADLDDAFAREAKLATEARDIAQSRYLRDSLQEFWNGVDRTFALVKAGNEVEARAQIRLSLQARHQAIGAAVARLLVQNNENEQQFANSIRMVYAGAERNVYIFVAAMLILILFTSLYLVHYNRRLFNESAALSASRSELARQLITVQENALRSISRDLHDDFGQVLTAVGSVLQRAGRHLPASDPLREDLREAQEVVQGTLEKVRTLSQALHPVILEEMGFEGALEQYLGGYQRQTRIVVNFEKSGDARPLESGVAIHIYRILQEALNNVAKHSQSQRANVRLRYEEKAIELEVEDAGIGFANTPGRGMGLVSMRERAGLVNGVLDVKNLGTGGTLVRLTIPVQAAEIYA